MSGLQNFYTKLYRNFRHDETNSTVCKINCRNDSEQKELQLYVLAFYTNLDNFMVCPLHETNGSSSGVKYNLFSAKILYSVMNMMLSLIGDEP
jgi:hypothetical protein